MNKKLGMMALTGAMALVACSQGPSGGGGNGTTTQSLTINLSGVGTAPITVKDANGAVVQSYDSKATASGTKLTLNKGTYTVTPGAVTGYITPPAQTANLNTADTALNFTYSPIGVPPVAVAKAVNLISIKDDNNIALPFQQETNDNKVATLFAAQTEESVCVLAKVVDANNAAVANAKAQITVTGGDGTVAVTDGCGSNINAQADSSNVVTTDASGIARFRLFATYGINNSGRDLKAQFDSQAQPVKILVEAKDVAGNTLTPLELKGFFLNMSHLYVRETIPAAANVPGAQPTVVIQKPDVTGRVNSSITAPFVNILTRTNPTGIGTFEAVVDEKQPQASLLSPMDFGGYVRYDVTGADAASVVLTSNDPADVVTSNTSLQDLGTPNGVTVALAPGATVPADRPLAISVKATYVFTSAFSPERQSPYEFPLKDISFNKQYTRGLLNIVKYVDHHVLSWVSDNGNAITTAATNSTPLPAEAIATYTIKVKNNGNATVYNASVADQLPAELGVQLAAISAGGTYDAIKHAITWNYTADPRLATVTPGQELTYTFQVYARQKPGYKWTGGNVNNDAVTGLPRYTIQPINPNPAAAGNAAALNTAAGVAPYADPYAVTDGSQGEDTTVAYFPVQNVFTNQIVTDYSPVADESTINVVRPLFRLTKLAQVEQNVDPGGVAVFQVNLTQLDRAGVKPAPLANEVQNGIFGQDRTPPSYAALFRAYPGEFDGKTANPVKVLNYDGTTFGTAAPAAARQNPYGVNINVADTFQTELDFTNSTSLNVTNPVIAGTTGYAPTNPVVGANNANQAITWSPVPLFRGLDEASAIVQLTVDQFAVTNTFINCAYMNANNLNQPARTTDLFANSIYAQQGYKPYVDGQSRGLFIPAPNNNRVGDDEVGRYTPPVAPFVVPGGSANLQIGLEACDQVGNIPVAPSLAITTKGEYTDSNAVLNDANKTDNIPSGNTFFYKFDVSNSGGIARFTAPANNLSFALDNANVIFPTGGSFRLYRSSNGVTWSDTGATATATNNTVTFTNFSVPGGGYVRAVLQGQASNTTAVNTQTINTATLTPATNAAAADTANKVTTENTTVLPAPAPATR